jgi:hypothetical protein
VDASAVRELLELVEPVDGVLNRFSAVASELPALERLEADPAAAAAVADDATAVDVELEAPLEEVEDDEVEAVELDEELELDDDPPPPPPPPGPRRLPRICGAIREEYRSGEVVPVRRMERSSAPEVTFKVRTAVWPGAPLASGRACQ